jgi:hypothetical protein
MQRISFIGSALAFALVGLMAACGSDPVSRVPFSPSAPGVSGLQIIGPASIAPGRSVQYTAQMRMSDGTVKSSANALNVRWRTLSGAIQVDSSSGAVTAGANLGETVLTAELVSTPSVRGTREILILPDGTYRVIGAVREADAPTQPIVGALVQVPGTSISATTDFNGRYRLYGVPPTAEIRVTANGYVSAAQNVQLTDHATRDFNLALSGPRLSLNGPFMVTIDVTGGCSSNPALASSLHHRTYEATVTTTGPVVSVQLTEPRFRVSGARGNRFTGRADALGVTFTLDSPYYYYYYLIHPSILEQLSNNTYLVAYGTAVTSPTSSGLSGPITGGEVVNFDSNFPGFNTRTLGRCSSARLSLTRR